MAVTTTTTAPPNWDTVRANLSSYNPGQYKELHQVMHQTGSTAIKRSTVGIALLCAAYITALILGHGKCAIDLPSTALFLGGGTLILGKTMHTFYRVSQDEKDDMHPWLQELIASGARLAELDRELNEAATAPLQDVLSMNREKDQWVQDSLHDQWSKDWLPSATLSNPSVNLLSNGGLV